MTAKMKREKRRFLRRVRRLGKLDPAASQWLQELSAQIDAFIEEAGVTAFADVTARFGTAEEIAQSMHLPQSPARL